MNKSESKKGKKIALVAVFVMLIFVFAFGGYSFAKYTTKGTGSDDARVAQWGIVVNADATGTFKSNYSSDGGDLQVQSSNGNKVVAPGTNGSVNFTVTGSAEVAVGIKLSVTSTSDVSVTYGTNVYNPLKFTLKQGANVVGGLDDVTLAEIVTYFETNTGYIGTFGVNTNFTTAPVVFTLSWNWDFNVSENNDILDTIIATNSMGATVGTDTVTAISQNVNFNVSLTVDQINDFVA